MRDLPKEGIVQCAYAHGEKKNHCIIIMLQHRVEPSLFSPEGANDMVGEGMRHRGAGTGDSGEAIPSNHEVMGSPTEGERHHIWVEEGPSSSCTIYTPSGSCNFMCRILLDMLHA